MDLFKNLKDYKRYLKDNPFYEDLTIEIESYSGLDKKNYETKLSLSSKDNTPLKAEFDDLIRLHYLVTSRKVTTIL